MTNTNVVTDIVKLLKEIFGTGDVVVYDEPVNLRNDN
jgi:hypothetical protein